MARWWFVFVGIGLTLAVGACAPVPGPGRWTPIPPACGSTEEPPPERSAAPTIPGAPVPEVVLLIGTATPRGCLIGVTIDAVDQFGRHGHNADYGDQPYPWSGIRRDPYTHRIWFDPRLQLEVSIEVFTHGEDYELRGCRIEYRGAVLTALVVEKDPRQPQSFTRCSATVTGPDYRT